MSATCPASMDERAERWICDRLARGPQALPIDLSAESVASAAQRHRIHLVLAAACGADRIDRQIRATLDDDVRRAVLYGAVREAECRRVLQACTVAGLTPLIFKGAALAYSVYGAPWTRPFVDVDMLVSPAEAAALRRVLVSLGYEPAVQVDGGLITHQAAFVRPGPAGYRHQIDVHLRLFNPEPLRAVFTWEELIARSEPTPSLSPGARRPCSVDALIIAAVHRAAHHNDADDLIWVWDIDRLARCLSSAEWRTVVATARRAEVSALCAAGLARASDCFSTPIPDEVLSALRIVGRERSAVFLGGHLRELDIQLVNLAHLRWRDRATFVAQHLFPGAAYMREKYAGRALPLPLLYAWRIAAGAPRWLRRGSQPRPRG
jgi:hypothetical protein